MPASCPELCEEQGSVIGKQSVLHARMHADSDALTPALGVIASVWRDITNAAPAQMMQHERMREEGLLIVLCQRSTEGPFLSSATECLDSRL